LSYCAAQRVPAIAIWEAERYPYATVFCPRCSHNNEDDAHFCESCGERLEPRNQAALQPQEPAPGVERTQFTSLPRRAPGAKPVLLGAVIAVLTIAVGAVFFGLVDENKSSSDGSSGRGQAQVDAEPTRAAGGATPAVTPSASPTPPTGPVTAPGYKLTAIFVPPQGSNDTKGMDQRLYDAIVQGVDWNDSARVYSRRYPLQYVFQNATTNLLLKPPNVEQAKRSLASAGYSATQKPKFLLAFNPEDRPFADWLSGQMTALGFNVVADANNFTADEKAKGYHGLIISVLPA
jgi:hypothetical protein